MFGCRVVWLITSKAFSFVSMNILKEYYYYYLFFFASFFFWYSQLIVDSNLQQPGAT